MNQLASELSTERRLYQQFSLLRQQQPGLRTRNAAAALQISEAELLACRADIEAQRLKNNWQDILEALSELGVVTALTRNEYCIQERRGLYGGLSFAPQKGASLGVVSRRDIDLRLLLDRWHFGYAVREINGEGVRHSLQFFDHCGDAVHKIYLTTDSDLDAYVQLVSRFHSDEPLWPQVQAANQELDSKVRPRVDIAAVEENWRALDDIDGFSPMLRSHSAERLIALQVMPVDIANQVPLVTVQFALQLAASKSCDITLAVSSSSCTQIYSGVVGNLRQIGTWFNVLDGDFNLHLDYSAVDQCWVTRKPTANGVVTAIEAYDKNGNLIMQLFGRRSGSDAESGLWRDIVVACECALGSAGQKLC